MSDAAGTTPESPASPASKKGKRTRSGCLNCRRKKRKCDESRPVCARCARVGAVCEWAMRVTFLPVNTVRPSRSDAMRTTLEPPCRSTSTQVRREQQQRPSPAGTRCIRPGPGPGPDTPDDGSEHAAPPTNAVQQQDWCVDGTPVGTPTSQQMQHAAAHLLSLGQAATSQHLSLVESLESMESLEPLAPLEPMETIDSQGPPRNFMSPDGPMPEFADYPASEDGLFYPGSAYLDLHAVLRDHLIRESRSTGPTRCTTPVRADDTSGQASQTRQISHTSQASQASHASQANHANHANHATDAYAGLSSYTTPATVGEAGQEDVPVLAMSDDQECFLWMNWIEEVAPWLDKFDDKKHFQYQLSLEAKTQPHLRFAILAVSARQIERKGLTATTATTATTAIPSSLALYQKAIHLLLPQLSTRSTAVIASCVVLCVLEMLSCAPKSWRHHLDGCSTLLQAVSIHGFSGGLEQALFWCFVRMDVCGGLISATRPLIPVTAWTPHGRDLAAAVGLFRSAAASAAAPSSDVHANLAVFLLAHVVDLLATGRPAPSSMSIFSFSADSIHNNSIHNSIHNHNNNHSTPPSGPRPAKDDFVGRWLALWRAVDDWYQQRPAQMHPLFTSAGTQSRPNHDHGAASGRSRNSSNFPTILFSSPTGVSGNQTYHTAALLLLQHKPPSLLHPPSSSSSSKPRPILWHARRIVGISRSNSHHGCWTNSLQPLWIAGRLFSSPDEHREILALLARIEKETGWATKWRADDLREWWGDLED